MGVGEILKIARAWNKDPQGIAIGARIETLEMIGNLTSTVQKMPEVQEKFLTAMRDTFIASQAMIPAAAHISEEVSKKAQKAVPSKNELMKYFEATTQKLDSMGNTLQNIENLNRDSLAGMDEVKQGVNYVGKKLETVESYAKNVEHIGKRVEKIESYAKSTDQKADSILSEVGGLKQKIEQYYSREGESQNNAAQ